MNNHPEFELKIVESLALFSESEAKGDDDAATDVIVTPQEAFDALQATKGSPAVLARFPELGLPETWLDTAYFSVCSQMGTAVSWNLVGVERLVGCRASFSGAVPNTDVGADGRIDLYFRAPLTGVYTMTAKFDSVQQASVECSVDSKSFGYLPIYGPTTQPHVAQLGQGRHRFRVAQRYGSFDFLSLTIWTPPQASRD